MLERFKKEFLYTNAPQFYGKTSARTFQHAVKKDITDNTYSIYAYAGTPHPSNGILKYHLIAVAENEDKVIRFFDGPHCGNCSRQRNVKSCSKFRAASSLHTNR